MWLLFIKKNHYSQKGFSALLVILLLTFVFISLAGVMASVVMVSKRQYATHLGARKAYYGAESFINRKLFRALVDPDYKDISFSPPPFGDQRVEGYIDEERNITISQIGPKAKRTLEVNKEAAPRVFASSKKNEGFWKEISREDFDPYNPGFVDYLPDTGPDEGWTSLGFTLDDSWGPRDFTLEHEGWEWEYNPPGSDNPNPFLCKFDYFEEKPDTISVTEYDTLQGYTGLYRKIFSIPVGYPIHNVKLLMFSDNDTAIYINETLVDVEEACREIDFDPAFLNDGDNILAIQLSNDDTNPSDNPMALSYELTINYSETFYLREVEPEAE